MGEQSARRAASPPPAFPTFSGRWRERALVAPARRSFRLRSCSPRWSALRALPRRIAERARLILSVQPILAGDRKRRRFSAAQFARESIFPEALAIFELNAAATGVGADQLARWQAIFLGQPVAELQIEPRAKAIARAAVAVVVAAVESG